MRVLCAFQKRPQMRLVTLVHIHPLVAGEVDIVHLADPPFIVRKTKSAHKILHSASNNHAIIPSVCVPHTFRLMLTNKPAICDDQLSSVIFIVLDEPPNLFLSFHRMKPAFHITMLAFHFGPRRFWSHPFLGVLEDLQFRKPQSFCLDKGGKLFIGKISPNCGARVKLADLVHLVPTDHGSRFPLFIDVY